MHIRRRRAVYVFSLCTDMDAGGDIPGPHLCGRAPRPPRDGSDLYRAGRGGGEIQVRHEDVAQPPAGHLRSNEGRPPNTAHTPVNDTRLLQCLAQCRVDKGWSPICNT